MSKNNNIGKAQTNAIVRMQQRIAVVQATRAAHHAARIEARAVAAEKAAKHAAYLEELKAIADKFGMPPPAVKSAGVRTSTAATPTAPKTGVTKQVWELAAQHSFDRKATLAACEQAGIKKATAQTQYALAKRASLTA